MRRALAGLAALAAAAALGACGSPEELSREDGRALAQARERLDDAIDTSETIRTSPEEARRLVRAVRRITSERPLAEEETEEFGLAALGRLQEVVPSLVLLDEDGSIRGLDREATRVFLRDALESPRNAVLGPAQDQVDAIGDLLEDENAGQETNIPVVRATADEFLASVQRDVRPIWPALAEDLEDDRKGL